MAAKLVSTGCLAFALAATSLLLHAQAPSQRSKAPGNVTQPQEIFSLVRNRTAAMLHDAPRYTCVETIERSRLRSGFQTRGGCEETAFSLLNGTYKAIEHDRLRLDVGVSNNEEIFSWHGQHAFVTSDITQLVNQGAISSGSFFAFIGDILINAGGRYFYRGTSVVNGKKLAVFSYTIPQSVSHFVNKAGGSKHIVPYHGEIVADPETGDLYSLKVDTDELPGSQACNMNQSVTYQEITIDGKPFRVPARVDLNARMRDHDEVDAVTNYINCHEFVGQSTIHFNNTANVSSVNAGPVASLPSLPPKLHLKLRLTSTIDSDSAWTGDPVTAVLENTLRGKHGRKIVSKGATLSGRIIALRQYSGLKPYWVIDIRFEELHADGTEYRVALESTSPVDTADPKRLFRHGSPYPEFLEDRKPGPYEFRVAGGHLHLDNTFVTDWKSVAR